MAGLLNFENGGSWMVKNWVFDRFLNKAISDHKHDPELARALQLGIYYNNLNLLRLRAKHQSDLPDRIMQAIAKTGNGILNGRGPGLEDLEAQGRIMFLDAVCQLLALIEQQSRPDAREKA